MRLTSRYACVGATVLLLLVTVLLSGGKREPAVETKAPVLAPSAPPASCLLSQGTKGPASGSVLLFVIVVSAPSAVSRRQTIRRTWLRLLPKDAALRFVVGTRNVREAGSLIQEDEFFNDLALLGDVEESYDALSNKVLAAFSWAWREWNFRYLLKADDDTFARVDVLADELRSMQRPPDLPLYWGFFDGRQMPKRAGKWKEGDFKLCDRFLPYAKGGGYVLSAQLVGYMACNADGLHRFQSEDMAVGVWLAPYRLERKHDVRFDTEWVSRGCDNRFIVTHKQSEENMASKYEELQRDGQLCEKETRRRGSYEYNWNVPPSQCCKRMSRGDRSIP